MAEQRLIDATSLKVLFEHEYSHNKQFKQSSVYKAWQGAIQLLYDQPTIDPETLPIVRQLREELARVTAERDAAIKDRAKLADYELSVCEGFCFGDAPHSISMCEWLVYGKCKLREWRGPQKEAHQ